MSDTGCGVSARVRRIIRGIALRRSGDDEDPTARAHYVAWRTITTRWSDNDAYIHVNNAIIYHWFDTAVKAWLINAGLLHIEQGDAIALVVDTRSRYDKSVAHPEPVEIGLALGRLGTSSVVYELGAFRPGEHDPLAEAPFTHVYVSRAEPRPVALPDAWRRALLKLTPMPEVSQLSTNSAMGSKINSR